MATAYHMEVLRKQRILERAREARERMQEQEARAAAKAEEEKAKEKKKHHHHRHKRSTRPASAQNISSSPKKSKTAKSPSPNGSTLNKMETSPSPKNVSPLPKADDHSKKGGDQSGKHSRVSTASNHSEKSPKNSNTSEQSRASSATQSGVVSGSENQAETITVSRCSKCRSSVSPSRSASRSSAQTEDSRSVTSAASASRTSSTTGGERKKSLDKRAELKAEAVRKDLHQQEIVLRDSNLVMGDIPVDEEVTLRALERQKLDTNT